MLGSFPGREEMKTLCCSAGGGSGGGRGGGGGAEGGCGRLSHLHTVLRPAAESSASSSFPPCPGLQPPGSLSGTVEEIQKTQKRHVRDNPILVSLLCLHSLLHMGSVSESLAVSVFLL